MENMSTDTIKLLPCPFCGYHGTLHSIDMCNTVYAVCMKCGSRTLDFKHVEEAIEKWNTRKPMQEIVERLEEVGKLEIKTHSGRCNGKTLTHGYIHGIQNAINLVKEVGGMND